MVWGWLYFPFSPYVHHWTVTRFSEILQIWKLLESQNIKQKRLFHYLIIFLRFLIFTLINLKTWFWCRLSNYDLVVELLRCFCLGNFFWLLFPKTGWFVFCNAGHITNRKIANKFHLSFLIIRESSHEIIQHVSEFLSLIHVAFCSWKLK